MRQPATTSPWFDLRYLLVAAAVATPLLALYFYPHADGGAVMAGIRSYLAAYAKAVGALVSWFDPAITVADATIRGPRFSMQIVKTCDAMEVNILLVAALVAFPMPFVRKLLVVLGSLASIASLNAGRLCLLYWAGVHAPASFDRVHQTLAPLFMVAAAVAIFLVGTRSGPTAQAEPRT
jgi:exosortase/archaeosortase family protein